MTMAVRPLPATTAPVLARVAVFRSMAEAEPHWRALENAGALMSAYQRFDFMAAWQRHLGSAEGVTPAIVVGFDAVNVPLVVLPLGMRRFGELKIVGFLGGKHVNFNLGLWRRDFVAGADANVLDRLAKALGADALVLRNQPHEWQGIRNPLSLWPHTRSPSIGHKGALKRDFEALIAERLSSSTRRKIRKKGEKLSDAGGMTFARADSDADALRLLDVFFQQKIARMRQIGQNDVFGDPDVQDFLKAAILRNTGRPPVEIYSLSVGPDVIATFAGVCDDERFSAMFNSIEPDRFQTESPGEQSLFHLVKHCCERGLKTFDLGIGEARYKNLFCQDDEPVFDTLVALSPAGRLYVTAARVAHGAKRWIKSSPAVWGAFERVRRLSAGLLAR
jgi:CelD/BcsL family acetyltransferase involved in cellulose biosynthesis